MFVEGVKDFTDYFVIFTESVLSIISIIPISNTMRKITAREGKTAVFSNRDCVCCVCRLVCVMSVFSAIYLTKWKIVAPSVKSQQEPVLLLLLSNRFEISVDDIPGFLAATWYFSS